MDNIITQLMASVTADTVVTMAVLVFAYRVAWRAADIGLDAIEKWLKNKVEQDTT